MLKIVPQFVKIVFCRLLNLVPSLLVLFIPHHLTDLLPLNPISHKMFLQLFHFTTTYFSSSLLPQIAVIRFNFFFNYTFSHFNHLICLLCSTVNKIWVYDVWKSLVLFKFYTVSQLFWKCFCNFSTTFVYSLFLFCR